MPLPLSLLTAEHPALANEVSNHFPVLLACQRKADLSEATQAPDPGGRSHDRDGEADLRREPGSGRPAPREGEVMERRPGSVEPRRGARERSLAELSGRCLVRLGPPGIRLPTNHPGKSQRNSLSSREACTPHPCPPCPP